MVLPRKSLGFVWVLAALVLAAAVGTAVYRALTWNDAFEPATVLRVSDGDTIYVRTFAGEEHSVRLIGIDAPESVNPDPAQNTPEGEAAAAFVRDLLPRGTTVYLVRDTSDTDKYGRWLRYVWLEVPDNPRNIDEVRTKMVQGIILDAGHAQARRYTPDTAYASVFDRIERTAGGSPM